MKLIVNKDGSIAVQPENAVEVLKLVELCGDTKAQKSGFLDNLTDIPSAPRKKRGPYKKKANGYKRERPGHGRRFAGLPWTCGQCGVVIPAKAQGVHKMWHNDHPNEDYGVVKPEKRFDRDTRQGLGLEMVMTPGAATQP